LSAEYLKEVTDLENEKVFTMKFSKVYPLLVAKAERKGRTKDPLPG